MTLRQGLHRYFDPRKRILDPRAPDLPQAHRWFSAVPYAASSFLGAPPLRHVTVDPMIYLWPSNQKARRDLHRKIPCRPSYMVDLGLDPFSRAAPNLSRSCILGRRGASISRIFIPVSSSRYTHASRAADSLAEIDPAPHAPPPHRRMKMASAALSNSRRYRRSFSVDLPKAACRGAGHVVETRRTVRANSFVRTGDAEFRHHPEDAL